MPELDECALDICLDQSDTHIMFAYTLNDLIC